MRVAFCIFKYFPYGGLQRHFLGMARECLRRGMQVRVYTLAWQGERTAELDVVEVPVKGFGNHTRYRRFATWVNEHLQQSPVDLVVGMNKMPGLDVYYAGDSCYAEKARSQRKAWYRLTPRYRLFAEFEQSVFSPEKRTHIFTISDRETQFFQKHYATPMSRFYRLPPGIDRDRVRPHDYSCRRKKVREEFGIGDDEKLILFVGSGYIKKGLDRAILAFDSLPVQLQTKSRMLVLGADKSTRFERMISKMDLAARIRILGGRDDIPQFLFAADALMLPAYDELGGIVIVEAMVSGLPILVTENCGFAHYVRSADAGLIQPLPFVQTDFNKKLEQLLVSPERKCWERNGIAFSRDPEIYQLFEKAVDRLEDILKDSGKNSPTPSVLPGARSVLAFCLFKYFPYGGMQRDFRRVLQQCLAAGYTSRVYTLSWQGEIPEGVELVRVPIAGLSNHTRYSRYIKWVLQDLRNRPVELTLGFNKMPGLDFYFAADPCYAEKALNSRSRLYRQTARYRFFRNSEESVFAPTQTTHILCLSQQQKRSFQKHYATAEDRFTCLAPGIERNRQRPLDAARIRAEFRRGFDLSEDDILLLMIGSGFRTKGVVRSLHALAALQKIHTAPVRLMVIGQDKPQPFRRLAERLGVSECFEVHSGREDIPRFLLGADLLLHPAFSENTGSVILEAMVAGLPVVASAVCGYARYIEEAGAGCVLGEPFAQRNFVAVLSAALGDTLQMQRWSEAGVAFGETGDIYNMPHQVLALIEQTLLAKATQSAAQSMPQWKTGQALV